MARLIKRSNNIDRRLARIERDLANVPKRAHNYFVDKTPKQTGNAKSKTYLRRGDTISAEYDYAVPLDNGRSDQAPFGMSKPTVEHIKGLIKSILR